MNTEKGFINRLDRIKDAMLAIRLDLENGYEELYIAPKKYLTQYLQQNPEYDTLDSYKAFKVYSSEDKFFKYDRAYFPYDFIPINAPYYEHEIQYKSKQPLGSFLLNLLNMPRHDFLENKRYMEELSDPQKQIENYKILEQIYVFDNPATKYLSIKFRDLYDEFLLLNDENLYFPIILELAKFEELYCGNPVKDYYKIQEASPENNIKYSEWISEFNKKCPAAFGTPASLILTPEDDKLCIATERSLLPLIAYYVNVLHKTKKRFRQCSVCNKIFLAPDLNKTKMCSAECKQIQKNKHSQSYAQKIKTTKDGNFHLYGQRYWATCMKAIKASKNKAAIQEATEAQKQYRRDARKWLDEDMSATTFRNKHASSYATIQNIMKKYNIPLP